ncbi:MAG: HD domain-containing protein [Lachnospiraceae bacterium]|nr:HD domain-containing protein [Lachnospiraceae bacterium]
MTQRLKEAYDFATTAHEGQFRKGSTIPFITHPTEVCELVATLTDDEDVIIAALLHDVVEDTKYTVEDIRGRFGDRVAGLVGYESEDKMKHLPPAQSWKIRKQNFFKNLPNEPYEARMITLCDKVSNMRSTVKCYREQGDAMWQAFNQKDPAEQAWYYKSMIGALEEFSDTALYQEYKKNCEEVFGV